MISPTQLRADLQTARTLNIAMRAAIVRRCNDALKQAQDRAGRGVPAVESVAALKQALRDIKGECEGGQ